MIREFSAQFADKFLAVAGIVLIVAAAILLIAGWEILLQVQWQGMAALVGLLLIALVIGHVLGGPKRDDRTALAISCATRHVGIAVIVATTFPGPKTATLIAAYVVGSALVSIPYLRWRRRSAAAADAA